MFRCNEKGQRANKNNLKKMVLRAFFRHYGSEKRSVWVGVCARVITGEKR